MITREFDLTIRVPQQDCNDTGIKLVQNDQNVYYFNIRITDGINDIDYLQVERATITFKKRDGHVVQGNLVPADTGYTYKLGTNEIACPGKVVASIQLYGAPDERLTTARFAFEVVQDLINPSIVESTTEFDALTRAISLMEKLEERLKDFPNDGDTSVQGAIDELRQQINALNADVVAHKAKKATETEYGHVRLADLPVGSSQGGKRVARFTIGTTQNGWTAEEVDYLCDGINDQEEIIQALEALPPTGGEIVILDGTYNITASINILKNNVSIRGNGNATILKRGYNSTDTDIGPTAKGLITLKGKSGCKIQDLQINGNKIEYTASYNYGIYLYSSSNNTITGNTCHNNRDGINLSSSNHNTVTGNTCNNNNNDGIKLSSSSYNTITGNTCYNNNTNGIYLYSSSDNNTVTGNTCDNNRDGIYLASSNNNTVTGNTCNNNNDGIYLSSSNYNTITGNTCNNNYACGIDLSSSNHNTVTGNTCNNNRYGIYLYSSSNNTITGNTCYNNDCGIYLSSSSNNTVTGNTCMRGTGQTGYTTDQYTIRLAGSGNKYNLISLNNCMGKAVEVEGGIGNSVWGNKFDATNALPYQQS